jgi:hypothetical protein
VDYSRTYGCHNSWTSSFVLPGEKKQASRDSGFADNLSDWNGGGDGGGGNGGGGY